MAELGFPGSHHVPSHSLGAGSSPITRHMQNTTEDRIKTSNTFGLNVFIKAGKSNDNSIISPKSFIDATQITAVGAHGETKTQIERALGVTPLQTHFTAIQERKNSHFKQFGKFLKKMSSIDGSSKNSQGTDEIDGSPVASPYIVVNRICVRKGLHLDSGFVSTVKSMFGAKADNMDFHGNPAKCVDSINSWVSKHTEGKIQSIVTRDCITADTSVIVVNAIYFKGEWEDKFNKSHTRPRPFKSADAEVKTDFMFKKSNTLYYCDEALSFRAVELPYVGNELSFIVILPNELDGLADLESHMDEAALERVFRGMKSESDLLLYLPKFKVETALELSSYYQQLGITDLFQKDKADLRGIESKGQLYVSAIAHKTCIEVNEEGCEAAAATAAILRAAGGRSKQYTIFEANHPFIFLIKDNNTDSILFIGKYCKPN